MSSDIAAATSKLCLETKKMLLKSHNNPRKFNPFGKKNHSFGEEKKNTLLNRNQAIPIRDQRAKGGKFLEDPRKKMEIYAKGKTAEGVEEIKVSELRWGCDRNQKKKGEF